MSDCKRKAIVVGSGIAGISAAIRLANKGFLVEVYESNSYPGGKLTVLQLGSYRFDAGPSLFTMPEYVNELFRISGRDPKDYFEYHTCKTACHYFFEDGTFLPFSSDKMMLLDQVGKTLNVDTRPLEKRFEKSAFIYEKTHYTFLESSLHQWKNYFRKEILKTIVAIPGLDIFTTMHKANESSLNHPKLVQIFDRYNMECTPSRLVW